MDTTTLIILTSQICIFIFLILLFFKNSAKGNSNINASEIIENATRQLVMLSNEKIKSEKEDIKTDLQNKKMMIEDLVKRTLHEIEMNNRRIESSDRERIGSFESLKKEVQNQRIITEQLTTTTENLRKVLSNNQLRGQFGEQIADDLLKMTGFVKGVDYEFNKEQAGSETRPDFAVFMPDGSRINVDAKFPYSNLQKILEVEDENSKNQYRIAFERDVKDKIKQVTSRDYINPMDKTVDFVILFIPNEMIFSYIYDKMNDIWKDAMVKKVILAGPFSFTAVLRLVRQTYDNFKYQENTQRIIEHIKQFEKEFEKYNEEFEKLGQKIEQASDQYQKINGVRSRQLIRTIDKIKIEEPTNPPEIKILKPES